MKIIKTLKQTGAYIRTVYKESTDAYSAKKGERLESVQNIVVTVPIDGVSTQFDGDEVSQNRLNRAYTVAKGRNKTVPWKTYDNSTIMLTADHILDILEAAGSKQTELWF